jgi:tRNA nucleotidyltransferase (CCA-adding enzyme)
MAGIPHEVDELLAALEKRGYTAYIVGGCVRDMLRGEVPSDWDAATSARPEQVLELFGGFAVPTGIKHGTVTVRVGGMPIETTTYRTDGKYIDHRHPETVSFADSVEDDLSRRDFTINAMAMDRRGKLVDLFGGRSDIGKKVIRCVGNGGERFEEDALRIMRALRFASRLGYSIDTDTERSMREKKELLHSIAWERIQTELTKLLCGRAAADVLLKYPDILGVVLPEILPAVGLDQRNPHHCYDVWEHTAHSVESVPQDEVLRLTMLLHDLGKPQCFSTDDLGVGHFYGHQEASWAISRVVLDRLKYDNATKERVELLVRWHDRQIPCDESSVRKCLSQIGEKNLRDLMLIKRADNLAQHPDFIGAQKTIGELSAMIDKVIADGDCFSLKQLAVRGEDMAALGYEGKEIGWELKRLLDDVMEGRVPNDRGELMRIAGQRNKNE